MRKKRLKNQIRKNLRRIHQVERKQHHHLMKRKSLKFRETERKDQQCMSQMMIGIMS
jgi:hypothetical protein